MIALLLAGCGPAPTPTTPVAGACDRVLVGGAGPTTSEDVASLLADVKQALYPELAGVSVELVEGDDDASFFWANLDLATLSDPPLERDYLVFHSVQLLDDPPSRDAVAAILAHELKHVLDYTAMDSMEMAEFGLWYALSDVSEYERETDLHAMELGCGAGLIGYRAWLYDRVDAETEAQKRIDYYTPGEIAAWMATR